MNFTNQSIRIKAKTWKRDSYGLYDYETNNFYPQNLEVCRPGKLIRYKNELNYLLPSLIEDSDESEQEGEVLARIVETSEGILIIQNNSKTDYENEMWLSIDKDDASKGHLLQKNDVVKLGRVIFKIKQICCEVMNSDIPSLKQEIINYIKEYVNGDNNKINEKEESKKKQEEETANVQCKICLSDKEEIDNPLISPCKCIGSVKFVHLKCLQNWIKSKLNFEETEKITTICFKTSDCELCKAKLPLYVNHSETDLFLVPFDIKMMNSFVILESFSKDKEPTGIHIIDLSYKNSFKIGRGHDCDLKLPDVSVSRVHAILNVSEGNLFLKDNYSKFGTLILLKEPIMLHEKGPKSSWVQCGKTIMKFSLEKPWSSILSNYDPLCPNVKITENKAEKSSIKHKVETSQNRFPAFSDELPRENTLPRD